MPDISARHRIEPFEEAFHHPDWVSLARAPFVFRRFIDGNSVLPGTTDNKLCAWMMREEAKIGTFVKDIKIDPLTASIDTTFSYTDWVGRHVRQSGHPAALKGGVAGFHILLEDIHDDPVQIRNLHSALCSAWLRMEQEFRMAVLCGACCIFARRGSIHARRFTPVSAEAFLACDINWIEGYCTGPEGLELFCVHVVATENEHKGLSGNSKKSRKGGKGHAVSLAIEDLEIRGLLNRLSGLERNNHVRLFLKDRGYSSPASDDALAKLVQRQLRLRVPTNRDMS